MFVIRERLYVHPVFNISPSRKIIRPEEGELFHAEDQTRRNNVRFSELLFFLDNTQKKAHERCLQDVRCLPG